MTTLEPRTLAAYANEIARTFGMGTTSSSRSSTIEIDADDPETTLKLVRRARR